MTFVRFTYATPSALESTRERQVLGLAADGQRPVRFHARVQEDARFPLRIALQALSEVVWSDEGWNANQWILDPVITVHPDRVFFEAFSQDQSSYGLVIADRELFETEGEVVCGTTNVDFTGWLHAALGEMRSSRETWLRVGAEGFEVSTRLGGGRFEARVDVPDDWVRGYLRLQEAMAIPGTRIQVRPVDLMAVIRYLRYTRTRVAPRALRYVFDPGQPPRIVLEPWEYVIECRGSEHGYTEPRVIRTWGRRRLRLLEPVLPYADGVEIYLKGHARPAFYAVHLPPGLTFVLGLSGWTENKWSGRDGSDLLLAGGSADDAALVPRALEILRERRTVSADDVARTLSCSLPAAVRALSRLGRMGRVIYDVQSRHYRHRELFAEPVDDARLFPPSEQVEKARALLDQGTVSVRESRARETRKTRRTRNPVTGEPLTREIIHRDWVITGAAGDADPVEMILSGEGRLLFGTCTCKFYRRNLLNLGPCEHMLALRYTGEQELRDPPASESKPNAPPDENDPSDNE